MIHRRILEHTKEAVRFAPARPAVKAGVRAAIATVVPLVVATALRFAGGLWLSLGGFNTAFLDKGGSYRFRAKSMGAAALAGALSATVGALAGRHSALAIPLTLLWVGAFSYARVYGAAAITVGNTAAVTFVVSLALPAASVSEALVRGGCVIAGSLWTMLLSLVLWPLRPYRPARLALAQGFRTVADYAEALATQATRAEGADWQTLIQVHHARIRETLEEAREVLAATRRSRHGESGRGERLLVLLQIADALFGGLIAVGDVLESLAPESRLGTAGARVEQALSAFARTLPELARMVETEGRPRRLPSLDWGAEGLREVLARAAAGEESLASEERVKLQHLAHLLAQLREFAGIAVETVVTLPDDRPPAGERAVPRSEGAEPEHPLWAPLRDNFSRESVVLRHVLRVGLMSTVAVALTYALKLHHGYWVTVTVITVMQPYTGSTFLKGLQRAAGTVLGGILAVLAATLLHDAHAMMGLVFLTAGLSIALMPLNYGLYTLFVTVTFVILAELGSGDWHLSEVRILDTLLGGALALVGMRLLWERPEKELLPEQLAEALRGDRAYFREAMAAYLRDREGPDPTLAEARRKMGLATLNAEASFQRFIAEPRRRPEPLEPLMTLLAYTRRFAAAVIALVSTRHGEMSGPRRAMLERFTSTTEYVLEDLAAAVARGRPPTPMPDFNAVLGTLAAEGAALTEDDALLLAQLKRVVRQLTVLHGAALRRVSPSAPAPAPDAAWGAGLER